MVSKLGGLRRFLKKEYEVGKLKRVLIFCDSDRPMEEMAQVLSKDLNGVVCREGWETSHNDYIFKDDITTLVSILRFEESLSARASAMAIFQDTIQLENDQGNKIREKVVSESVVNMNSNNKVRILFCNDLAARGLDITDVSHVINFDMPKDSDSYIHRGGRAGRLGRPGFVVTLIISSQEFILERLANKIGLSIRCSSRQKPIPHIFHNTTTK
jgi:superfamily II DNA/RNA helicase